MHVVDDAFLHYLSSCSGRTIAFLPGAGGLDDAINGLAFHRLCQRFDIACRPPLGIEDVGVGLVVVGSLAAAVRNRSRLQGRQVAVLPGSVSRFEELRDDLGEATTLFWRDRSSLRRAELQGIRAERSILCHDLAVHLHGTLSTPDEVGGMGAFTVDVHGHSSAAGGDRLEIRLDGSHDRWASPDLCLQAIRSVSEPIAGCTELTTDSPSLAIVAAQAGKAVRLSGGADPVNRAVFDGTIAPLYPDVTFVDTGASERGEAGSDGNGLASGAVATDPGLDVARLRALVAAARREVQYLTQERDRNHIAAAEHRDRSDVEAMVAVRSCREKVRTAEDAERRASEGLADARAQLAEQRLVADAAKAEAESAAERGRRKAADLAGVTAEREAHLRHRIAELDAECGARTQQALASQSAGDEKDARALVLEARTAQMHALVHRTIGEADAVRRDAEALRRKLDEVLSSVSWRASRPLRGMARLVRRWVGRG